MSMSDRYAVVGGGIVGLSVAYHLAGAAPGAAVTVYERGDIAGETTTKSAAFFGFYGSAVDVRLKRYGMATYNEFAAEPRSDFRFDLVGRLDAATTAEGAQRLRERTDHAGEAPRLLDPDALRERLFCPELDPGALEGVRYRPNVGFLDPVAAAREFAARARERGVEIRTGTSVEGVAVADGDAIGVRVDGETLSADEVVCCAGPWTRPLLREAGIDLPIEHSLAPILRVRHPEPTHTLPIVTNPESGAYVRGHADDTCYVGYHPGDTDAYEPDDVSQTVSDDARAAMRDMLRSVVPPLADAPAVEEWVGIRSAVPDGHPILGRTELPGLSVAAFDTSGIQLAPAAGRIVAGRLVDGEADPLGAGGATAPDRF
jgi:glycine/D-amino acid oxidase-like deaminating enzyme